MSLPTPAGRGRAWVRVTRLQGGPGSQAWVWAKDQVTRIGDLRGSRCFYHGGCCSENSLLSAAEKPQRGRGGRAHPPGCSRRASKTTPDPHLYPSLVPPGNRALCFPLPSGLKVFTLIKVTTSHLDQCNSHPQPSPCTPVLTAPSQLLDICQRSFNDAAKFFKAWHMVYTHRTSQFVLSTSHVASDGQIGRHGSG